jgi:hypothetical protein
MSASPGSSSDEESSETVVADEGFMTVAESGGDGGAECPLVDILFVIDNSHSMAREQETLISSISGFVDGIDSQLGGENDFHLGVITTDAFADNPPGCQQLGDLVTTTQAGLCGPYAMGNFMTALDPLDEAFGCAASVGTEGSPDEQPMAAMIAALSTTGETGEGSCNESFLREDALLVIVIVSDEDDDADLNSSNLGSPGDPADWFAAVLAQRGGIEHNMVVLSIIGVTDSDACGAGEFSEPGVRLENFTTRFSHYQVADICEDDYSDFFSDALSLVFLACSGFTPPG